jgi:hypothetical protein
MLLNNVWVFLATWLKLLYPRHGSLAIQLIEPTSSPLESLKNIHSTIQHCCLVSNIFLSHLVMYFSSVLFLSTSPTHIALLKYGRATTTMLGKVVAYSSITSITSPRKLTSKEVMNPGFTNSSNFDEIRRNATKSAWSEF